MAASPVGTLTDPTAFATVPAPTIGDGSWADCVGEFDNPIPGVWGPPDGNPFSSDDLPRFWPEADGDNDAGELPQVLVEALARAVTDGRNGRGCAPMS